MKTKFVLLPFIIVLISACTGTSPTEIPVINIILSETHISEATATPLPLPTITPPSTLVYQSPEPSGFPFAAQLNEALPKENLLLATHFYADTVGHITGDEYCYDIGIYNDDSYIAISCLPDFMYPSPTGILDATQSKFLHRWVETFQSFDEPSIHGLVKFAGIGNVIPGIADKVSMQAMIGELEWNANGYIHRGGTPPVVFHARTVLSNQLNMWLDNSSILTFEVVDFPDSCLGAPKPNEICEPVTTQGFRIYLVANNLMYDFHTDTFGYDIRPFGEPQIAPTQGAGG